MNKLALMCKLYTDLAGSADEDFWKQFEVVGQHQQQFADPASTPLPELQKWAAQLLWKGNKSYRETVIASDRGETA